MADQDRSQHLEVLNWINGKDNGVRMYTCGPEPGTKWYIVSSKWLNRWKKLYKLTDEDTEDQMQEDLGRVNSDDIIINQQGHFVKKTHIIRPDAKLGVDFEALPEKAWKFFRDLYGHEHKIIRTSIYVNKDTTQIEISLFKLRIIFVIDKQLYLPSISTFHFSRSSSITQVIKELNEHAQTLMTKQDYPSSKLWKLDVDEILQQSNGIKDHTDIDGEERDNKAIEKLSELIKSYKRDQITFPGILIEKIGMSIANSEIREADLFVLETKAGYNCSELFKEKNKEMCEFCRKHVAGGRRCFCKKFYYCNDMCEDKDKNYHCCRKKVYVKSELSKMGKVGLQNLGNTCYMNSGLQCLSNTKALTEFILQEHYLKDLNAGNILGSKGKLITEYAALIKEMWYGTSSYISPWGVRNAFSEFAKQFLGFQQQDSQEMLGYLIDGIHEDLNRVLTKPYIEDPVFQGITEQEYASKFWENHKKRNDSIIVDLMHGQYRSEVECPDCSKISLTFDPFLMITLPIPDKVTKTYEFNFVEFNEVIRGKVTVAKTFSAENIKLHICNMLNVSPDGIEMAEISMNTIKSILSPSSKVKKRTTLALYKKIEHSQNPENTFTVFLDFRKKSYGYNASVIGIPYLFSINKDASMEDLYKEVYKFTLKLKKMEIDDIEEEFKKNFPNFFSQSIMSDNYFSLKIHNPYQFPCSICERISCPGCTVQYESRKFSYYLSKCKESNIRISAMFSDRINDYNFTSTINNHDSYFDTTNSFKPLENIKLSECFELFSRKEQLDEQNTIYCSSCKEHKRGLKKMEIYRLPEIFVIHLKRFKQKKHFSSKNNRIVEFPIEGLNMAEHSLGQEGIYDLYAVSNHYGSLEGGHYTAFAKGFDGLWRDFNDNNVSLINDVQQTVIGASAYVLFYERRKN